MQFTLNIDTDSQAYTDNPRGAVSSALVTVAGALEAGFDAGAVRDGNGNLVGAWSIVAAG